MYGVNKSATITFAGVFVLFYLLNWLTPMAFGDDYLYTFIWQGHSMFTPLTEEAVRISSLKDVFVSQWSHYFTWSGRAVSHTLIQLFLWAGKPVFNLLNSFIAILLIAEIYWCAHKGKVSLYFDSSSLCWISFALWAFTPGFSGVFLWISGACNYLWTAVFLLGFLLPYIRKYYCFEEVMIANKYFKFLMFFLGMIAGWSNENGICWIILVLFLFIFVNRNSSKKETWMFAGLAGLIIGYALLMFAPGNVARLHVELSRMNVETGTVLGWLKRELIGEKLAMLSVVSFFQFLLWYFCLRSLYQLRQQALHNESLKKERKLAMILCFLSFCMTIMMFFSPRFPLRSSFPGTIQLVIAGCILLRIQGEYDIEIVKKNAKRFLFVVGLLYMVVTVPATLYGFYDYNSQIKSLIAYVQNSEEAKEKIITVQAIIPVSEALTNASGLHIPSFEMFEDENFWSNVAFSRYYGIKGIRMIKNNVTVE